MSTRELIPLDCGHITEVERSAHAYMTGFGEKVCAQSVLWLIRGGEFPVVVDVGAGNPELVKARHGRELVQEVWQRPREAVAAAGVDPDDVRLVVQTHLHWDHALGLELNPFPHADIYLQRREVAYAASAYPPHAGLYDADVIRKLVPTTACRYPNVKIIDGDLQLDEGLDVLLTPGHTPGTQAVVIEAGGTRYAIASDNVPFASSWRGRTIDDWTPSGIHVSLQDCYESMARVASAADVVLPSHDAVVLGEVYKGQRPAFSPAPDAGHHHPHRHR